MHVAHEIFAEGDKEENAQHASQQGADEDLCKGDGLKDEYDSVSDEMGSIYYKGFSEEEITRFEECLDRIRKNLEEWQES